MPVVLIVDDSEVDRRLVGGLLPKDLEWLIEFADNGVEALEKMRLSLPDVVITDMLMPEMDGMELVSNISVDYPNIPVILITGHGNESLAVEALEKGATSYVPKQFLADKLQETVEQVLAVAKADRSYSRLISCLKNTQYLFALDNDPALIPPLVDLLQQMLAGMRCCDATGTHARGNRLGRGHAQCRAGREPGNGSRTSARGPQSVAAGIRVAMGQAAPFAGSRLPTASRK